MKQLEQGHLIKTGPMVPYENKPGQALVILSFYSKREYAYLTEDGYRAAQASTPAPRATRATITNNFHAPVNAVAQGNASIGSAQQTISASTPVEFAEAVAAIIRALPSIGDLSHNNAEAAQDLEVAEKELREGKMPIGRLVGSLNLLGKAEDIALRAPEAVQHIQTLLSNLGLS